MSKSRIRALFYVRQHESVDSEPSQILSYAPVRKPLLSATRFLFVRQLVIDRSLRVAGSFDSLRPQCSRPRMPISKKRS